MTRCIAITGASRGLGAELAIQLAGPDVTLCLCARDVSTTEGLTETLTKKGARVKWAEVDVSKTQDVTDWIERVWQIAPIDMLILNAGIFDGRGEDGLLESADRAATVIATNLTGSITPALTVATHMRERGAGHIVFISSLASLTPHADAPSYSASKAGVTGFARALREDLVPSGVCVTLVHAGHIKTEQSEQHIGSLPALVTCEIAAHRILRGIERAKCEVNFPTSLHIAIRLLRLLPHGLQARLNKLFRFRVRPPNAPRPR